MAIAQNSIYMFRKSVPQRFAPSGGAFGLSFVLHCSLAFLLFHTSRAFYAAPQVEAATAAPNRIYYIVPILQASKTLPRIVIREAGEGPRPSSQPLRPAEPKGITFPENLAVVSRPKNPDNRHQTIRQPNAPNIRIQTDLPLPNVIMEMAKGAALETPIESANAKPLQHQARLIDEEAPKIAPKFTDSARLSIDANSQTQLPMLGAPSAARVIRKQQDSQAVETPAIPNAAMPGGTAAVASGPSAQLPAPSVSVAKPIRALVASANALEIPAISGTPEIRFSQGALSGPQALPSPVVSIAKPAQRTASRVTVGSAPMIGSAPTANVSQASAFGSQTQLAAPTFVVAKPVGAAQKAGVPSGAENPPNPGNLVIIGINPSAATSQIILPPGTRLGAFVIAPTNDGPTGGVAHNAQSSAGKPTGSSPAHVDAGGKSGSGLNLSVGNGGSNKPEASGALGPPLPPDTIFPVSPDSLARKNRMVVATGPTGGGGLGVYGVLNCGKIFTIFLPMPGKNWTMQYCAAPGTSEGSVSSSGDVAIQWGEGIVPPEPESKFDFHRLPIPGDRLNKLIVLKGMLRADGTVVNLTVYRGATPQMDEAAQLAFGRWKFKPALFHGVPVPVELLIGIPISAR